MWSLRLGCLTFVARARCEVTIWVCCLCLMRCASSQSHLILRMTTGRTAQNYHLWPTLFLSLFHYVLRSHVVCWLARVAVLRLEHKINVVHLKMPPRLVWLASARCPVNAVGSHRRRRVLYRKIVVCVVYLFVMRVAACMTSAQNSILHICVCVLFACLFVRRCFCAHIQIDTLILFYIAYICICIYNFMYTRISIRAEYVLLSFKIFT